MSPEFVALLSSLLFLVDASSIPKASTTNDGECSKILQSAGASEWFGANVGHAIHSINLRALQKFEPTTTEKNSVPTINMDLSADQPILFYAPDRRGKSDGKFMSEGMKTVDEVLSHMNEKWWDIKYFTPLERVVHAFHMEEAWAMVHMEYQKIKKSAPSAAVCKCARDIEKNGVLKMLRFNALAIREAPLVYGDKKSSYQKSIEYYIPYTYHFKPQDVMKENGGALSLDQLLLEEEKSMPKLKDAASWEKWKEIADMSKAEHFDAALFLYCTLNNV